jgi:hypothetical protein
MMIIIIIIVVVAVFPELSKFSVQIQCSRNFQVSLMGYNA